MSTLLQVHWTVIRLSSLGDILLAFRFVLEAKEPIQKHALSLRWVTSREYVGLISALSKRFEIPIQILGFDRSSLGIWGWVRFFWDSVLTQPSTKIFDLHGTLRSRVAKLLWRWARLRGWIDSDWISLPKQRGRYWGKRLAKSLWPESLAPTPWRIRYAERSRQALVREGLPVGHSFVSGQRKQKLRAVHARFRVGVVPASKWTSKEWGNQNWEQYLKQAWAREVDWVLLGVHSERASDSWRAIAAGLGLSVQDQRATDGSEQSWGTTFSILDSLDQVLGVDTGLMHLAELLGIPTTVLFGPTTPDLGFGPERGRSIGVELGCRPCGRDGRRCWRVWEPYACWNRLKAEQIVLK